jgi:hypothetical protein
MSAAKWSIAYGAINAVSESLRGAISYATDLNAALNDI